MTVIEPGNHLRITRPSANLAVAERFWCDGIGLQVLWRTGPEAQGGHALLMVGHPDGPWHLELVHDSTALALNPPGPEDLLVLYRGRPLSYTDTRRITEAGGAVVPARNPYWDQHGTTIRDPDGHLLVLARRTWGRPGAPGAEPAS